MTQNDYERWPRIGIILTKCLKNKTKPVIKTEKDIKIMKKNTAKVQTCAEFRKKQAGFIQSHVST